MVLCPDGAPFVDHRFDCGDLLQRGVIHYESERKVSSAIISAPIQGVTTGTVRVYLAALPKIEAPALSPLRSGLLFGPHQLAAFVVVSPQGYYGVLHPLMSNGLVSKAAIS